jgi:hypothetical protein
MLCRKRKKGGMRQRAICAKELWGKAHFMKVVKEPEALKEPEAGFLKEPEAGFF